MRELEADVLRELLIKCWMTHDGTWFYSCFQEYGIEAANRLNKSAIKLLAPIEVRRVTRGLGIDVESIRCFDELRASIDGMFSVISGEFMGFEYSFHEENVMQWQIHRCFAFEGMKRIGASDSYECGVLYRVMCWMDELGIEYTVEPAVEGCLMRDTGRCEGSVRFDL